MMFDRFLNRPRAGQAQKQASSPQTAGVDAAPSAPEGLASVEAGGDYSEPAAPPRFDLGQVVRHRVFPFRGVIFDVDPEFANSEEWWQSIPEAIRPAKNQPFYHLLAENGEGSYVAYVSQQNLLPDESGQPVGHPAVSEIFEGFDGERYRLQRRYAQ